MNVPNLGESQEDFTCRMVLEVCQLLADGLGKPHHRDPTGCGHLPPEMRPYVERRSDDRRAA